MKFDKILVPVDFSPSALHAVSSAFEFARTQKSHVTLLHVIDVIYYSDYAWLGEGAVIPRDIISQNKGKVEERLNALVPGNLPEGVVVDTKICEGAPFREVLDVTEEVKPDLIIMGTHGRRGLSHLFLGSVAEKVVRMAPCPVLIVKAEGANDSDQKG